MAEPIFNPLEGLDLSNLGFDTQPNNPNAGVQATPELQGLADKLREEYEANRAALNAAPPAPESRTKVALSQALAGAIGYMLGGGYASAPAQQTAAGLTENILKSNDAEALQAHEASLKSAENALKSRDEIAKGLRMLYQSQPDELRKDPVLSELAFPGTSDLGTLFAQSAQFDGPSAKMLQEYWHKAIQSGDLHGESLAYAHTQLAKAYGIPKKYITSDLVDVDGGMNEKWAWEHVVNPWPIVQQLREGKQLTVRDVQVKSPHRQPSLNSEQLDAMGRLAEIIRNNGGMDRMTVPEAMTKLDEYDQILLDSMEKDPVFRRRLSMEDMVRIRLGLQHSMERYNPGGLLQPGYVDATYNDALGAAMYDSQRALTGWFNNEMDAAESAIRQRDSSLSEEEIEKEAYTEVYRTFKRRGYTAEHLLPSLAKKLHDLESK
jgi:hypothetical protein